MSVLSNEERTKSFYFSKISVALSLIPSVHTSNPSFLQVKTDFSGLASKRLAIFNG